MCFACGLSCDSVWAASGPHTSQNKDSPGYRSSGKIRVASRRCTEEEEEEHEFIRLHISKYTMVVIVVNEQCNTGDPLETSGGLYRGPPSMLI